MTPSRELLLRVRQAFMAYGYQHMSMVALSQACGFTRRSLYNYFANKDEAFRAMFLDYNLEIIDRAWGRARAIRTGGGSVLDVVSGLIDVRYGDLWRILRDSPHAAEMKGTAFALCPDIMVDLAQSFQADFVDLIEELGREGRLTLKGGFTPAQLVQMLTDAARGVNQVYPMASLDGLSDQYRQTCQAILYGYIEG